MKLYIVGGFVRDTRLGLTPKDRDWVVVNATSQEMLDRGFTQVGKDFPVFLHPETHEEYALARVERKAGHGYNGFEVTTTNVTLEDDLSRRDLTINAMALDEEGRLQDPYGGERDLAQRTLRHVSVAFAEDPLRVLRLARFLAKLGPQWTVASETLQLVKEMVNGGELDFLTPERIWKEIEKGLLEQHPEQMLKALVEWNVLQRKPFEEYRGAVRAETSALQKAAEQDAEVAVRFALGFPGSWGPELAKQSRIPAMVREVSHLLSFARNQAPITEALTGETRLKVLEGLDAVRQQDRFNRVAQALALVDAPSAQQLVKDVAILKKLDYGQLVKGIAPSQVKNHLRSAKVAALQG